MEPELPISSAALAAIATRRLDEGDLDDVLRNLCEVTVAELRGADEASVSIVTDDGATTFGATSNLPLAADERQYERGTGPCLDAARANQPVIVDDATADDRWPATLRAMAGEGVLSSLSIPLPLQGAAIGALNIYSRTRRAFSPSDVPPAQSLAGVAAVAVANAMIYADATRLATQMQSAMESRAVIEQAKGIIMGRVGCDADHAFELLVQQSQHENRKLREIATEIVERAASSRGGPPPPSTA